MKNRVVYRLAVIGLLVLAIIGGSDHFIVGGGPDVEQRIGDFWKRIDAMQPGDYLSSADIGQWALNVIDRDAATRITVADFRAATTGMQVAMERAGRAPDVTQPGSQPSTGYVRFHGRVVDAATGQGIPDICLVISSLNCATDKPQSDANGYWSVDLTIQPYWDITFQSSAGRYRTVTTRVYSLGRTDVLVPDIRMRSAEAAIPPTARPPIRGKVGQWAIYDAGWKVTLLAFGEQQANQYKSPSPGFRFVYVTLRFDNGSANPVRYSQFDFRLQDGAGVRRPYVFSLLGLRNDTLDSGTVSQGSYVSGSMVFEAPIGDQRPELIYESSYWQQAVWELY